MSQQFKIITYANRMLKIFTNGEVHRLYTRKDGSYNHQFRIIPNIDNSGGYNIIVINKQRILRHRLLASHFVNNPKPDIYKEVDHIDRNPLNNDVSNLRWADDIIQSNNRCGYGKLGEKYISIEKGSNKKKRSPNDKYMFLVRSKIYGSHKKRFDVNEYSLDDVIKYRNDYFKNKGFIMSY